MTLINFLNHNKDSENMCAIVQLQQPLNDQSKPFHLDLLMYGSTVVDDFKLPPRIRSIKEVQKGVNTVTITIKHEEPQDVVTTFIDITFKSINPKASQVK